MLFRSHPNGIGVPGMTADEKMTLARWVDLGAPLELAPSWGFLEDDLRPTLAVRPSTERARAQGSIDALEISAFDVDSGIAPASLTVTSSLRLGSVAPGGNLAAGKTIDPEGKILRLALPRRVALSERPTFTITVRDKAGHKTEVVRTFRP